jgi:hypothetical protein
MEGQTETALVSMSEAISVARGWEYGGRQIGSLWDQQAKILRKLGRTSEAETAEANANCARTRRPAWACGGALSFLTLGGAEGAEAKPETTDPAGESPKAGGGDRGDWRDLEVRTLPQRWEFSEPDLPKGWVRTGYAQDTDGVLIVGDSKGTTDVACTPLLAMNGPLSIHIQWQADILSLDPPTWAVIELRPSGTDGRPLTGQEAARFFATRRALPMTTDQAVWTPPEGTQIARLCVKTGGAANGSSRVDWLELSAGSP